MIVKLVDGGVSSSTVHFIAYWHCVQAVAFHS